MFVIKNRPGAGEDKSSGYCTRHNQRIIQLGNCLTCTTIASICETKGCIKQHQEERIHNVYTIEYVRHIVREYMQSDQSKKSYLKKMIADYFAAAKKELEILYEEIYQAVDFFKFDNLIFNEEEKDSIRKLVNEEYNTITCAEVAVVLPKLVKYTTFEDGHFDHLRSYVKNEKEKIVTVFDSMILNLPYFREQTLKNKQKEYLEVSSEYLRQVNDKIKQINYRPKKLRIKYIDDQGEEDERKQFIRNLCVSEMITGIEELELYCLWDIKEEDFQAAFFEALTRYPFLKHVNIYTGYKVTSTAFVDEIISEGAVDVKIYKKQWTF